MKAQIIAIVVNFVVSGLLGYSVNVIKNYKKKLKTKESEEQLLKVALMTMLQSNLTNTYFVYSSKKKIPDYVYKNWLNEFKIYKNLGGNDYCHTLEKKMEDWEIISTDILNK